MTADGNNAPAPPLKSASVLIVEDQNFVRELLSRLLASLSVPKVRSVPTAEEALSELERDPAGIDVIFVDYELPGMSGMHLIEKLRASPDSCLRDIAVVMLTAHSDLGLYRDATRLGIAAFLVKPAGPAALKSALEDALAGRRVSIPGD